MSQRHDKRSQPDGGGASRQNEKVTSSVSSQGQFSGDYTTWDTTTKEQFATLLVSQGIADYSQAMNAMQQGNGQQIAAWQSRVMSGDTGQQYSTQRQKDTGT